MKKRTIGKINKENFNYRIEDVGSVGIFGAAGTGKTFLGISLSKQYLKATDTNQLILCSTSNSSQRKEPYYKRHFEQELQGRIRYVESKGEGKKTSGMENVIKELGKVKKEIINRQNSTKTATSLLIMIDDIHRPTIDLRLKHPELYTKYIEAISFIAEHGKAVHVFLIVTAQSCVTNECPRNLVDSLKGYFLFNTLEREFTRLSMYKTENLHTPKKTGECWYRNATSLDTVGIRIDNLIPIS